MYLRIKKGNESLFLNQDAIEFRYDVTPLYL